MKIYVDNAATTKLDPDALEAMRPYLQEEYGNASQPYFFGRNARKALTEAREIIAQCINADPEEIFFTSGGTESDNWAIKGSAFNDNEKRATITTAIEHHAVLNSCRTIERLGYPVSYIHPEKDGNISLASLEEKITEQTRLVSIMLANNEIGTIEPIKELAVVAHRYGAVFHTDAVQGVGHVPIDVKQLDIDMLSASAHKFNGPKGIGFLYTRKGTSICPYSDGGAQEYGMRAGTENIAAIVGMAAALKSNCDHIVENMQRIVSMEEHLIAGLSGLDYVRNGASKHVPGNVSLSFADADGEAILHRMDLKGICISTGSACDSVNNQLSHVIEAIGIPKKYARGTIRISIGKNNTTDEMDSIIEVLRQIVKKNANR